MHRPFVSAQSTSPENGNRFRNKDMRKNKDLKRGKRIEKIATRFTTDCGW
ncbi:hypothetical protein J2Y48_001141 [Mycoplana sp. BE70]|nr:hypothetical protein [Mycoplana sp. BE70]